MVKLITLVGDFELLPSIVIRSTVREISYVFHYQHMEFWISAWEMFLLLPYVGSRPR